jgi:hypothetical protein
MDKLKNYLQQHKEALDVDEPSTKVWEGIVQQTSKPKRSIMLYMRWAVAACIIGLAVVGGISLFTTNKPIPVAPIAQQTPTTIKTATPPVAVKPTTEKPIATKQIFAAANSSKQKGNNNLTANKTIEHAVQKIDADFIQVVTLQREKINNTPLFGETQQYFNAFKLQMQMLDKDEAAIRTTIKTKAFDDELLTALITIYQQKLALLKSLQTEINKTNNRYKQTKEPVDTTASYFINI